MSRTIDITCLGNVRDVERATNGAVRDALAYLMTYALPNNNAATPNDYVSMVISTTDNEVSALYARSREEAKSKGMLMVAVWHPQDGRYSYHT